MKFLDYNLVTGDVFSFKGNSNKGRKIYMVLFVQGSSLYYTDINSISRFSVTIKGRPVYLVKNPNEFLRRSLNRFLADSNKEFNKIKKGR